MGLNRKGTYLCNRLGALLHSLRPDISWGKIGQNVRKLQLWEGKTQNRAHSSVLTLLLSYFPSSALWLSVIFCMQVTSVSVGDGCKWVQRFSSASVCFLSEDEDGAQCSRACH